MIKSIRMEYTNWMGIKKEIEFDTDMIKSLNNKYTIKDNIKRFVAGCKSYSKNYWVTGYINNHKVCWFQWDEV